MNIILRLLLVLVVLAATASASHAQATYVPVYGIFKLAQKAARGDYDDKSVTMVEYRTQTYPMKRSVPEMLTGGAANEIVFLETQLDLCRTALLKDSTGTVCTAGQQNTLRTLQSLIAKAQPSWPLRAYRNETAFYVAEEARRQRLAAAQAPAVK